MSHRLFICCCKGFFRDENKDELYQLLDLDRRATAADIKRAYRNKSLQMHPDKLNQKGKEVTDEDRANFQKMKAAYDVLSDQQKRELYDQLGETGMMMIDDPLGARDKMFKNFLKMSTRDRLRLVIFVLMLMGALLLWPILFCIKLDGDLSASWVALWTPLWIYNALGLYFHLYLVSSGSVTPPEGMEDGWVDPFPLHVRLYGLVRWILLVVFQIFLTMRLDDDTDWNWLTVGIPILAWLGMQLCMDIYEALKPLPMARSDDPILDEDGDLNPDVEKREQAMMKRFEARAALPRDLLWILQAVFLVLKLDDEMDWNWWAVFIPTWLVVIWQLVRVYIASNLVKAATNRLEGKSEEDQTEDEKLRAAVASQRLFQEFGSSCTWMFYLVTIILAVNAIAGADYSAFVIFIPQFAVAGLVVCCLTCLICCVRMDPDDLDNLGEVDVEQGGPQVPGVPPHVQQSYGTYTPPAVGGTADAGKETTGGRTGPQSVVIAMPPSSNVESSPEVPVTQPPPQHIYPAPSLTPAPESQADGGID